MEKKKSLSITFIIVAIIVGTTLYKQFSFETLTFEKPALAVVYGIVFIGSVFILIKGLTASENTSAEEKKQVKH